MKSAVETVTATNSGFSGPHTNKFLAGPIKGDTTGLLEHKKTECVKTPECKGITSTRPYKDGKKFKMRTNDELEDSAKGEISYLKL